ncbi:MAG: GNAT family acetyltransferase [Candidatus Bathyarchaeota archaeon B23]|nr:MAG: GNAT family acetyltransferase [Candidatus Bathyarchaeota archaeon B23]
MRNIVEALELVIPLLEEMVYDPIAVNPREFLEYLLGPTTTGDRTTLREILESRYLLIHELVEIDELKRRGIAIGRETVVSHPAEVYEAHLRAAEVEFSLAEMEGDRGWLGRRLRDAESWLQDPSLPPRLRPRVRDLIERFRQKKVGAHSDRPAAAE